MTPDLPSRHHVAQRRQLVCELKELAAAAGTMPPHAAASALARARDLAQIIGHQDGDDFLGIGRRRKTPPLSEKSLPQEENDV